MSRPQAEESRLDEVWLAILKQPDQAEADESEGIG